MPNVNAPYGFRPTRYALGADWTAFLETRDILNSDATAIGRGDVVKDNGNGYITRATAADNANVIYGIFWGVEYYDKVQQRPQFLPNWPAPGAGTALVDSVKAQVLSDPNVVFTAQVGGSTVTGVTRIDIGSNIGILDGAVAANGFSTQGVDQTTLAVTATLPFRVVALSPIIGVDLTAAYDWVEVQLNNARFRTTTGI